jgi:hypothetical protein
MMDYVLDIINQIKIQIEKGILFDNIMAHIELDSENALVIWCNEDMEGRFYTVYVADYITHHSRIHIGDYVHIDDCGLKNDDLFIESSTDSEKELEECIYEVLGEYFNS